MGREGRVLHVFVVAVPLLAATSHSREDKLQPASQAGGQSHRPCQFAAQGTARAVMIQLMAEMSGLSDDAFRSLSRTGGPGHEVRVVISRAVLSLI